MQSTGEGERGWVWEEDEEVLTIWKSGSKICTDKTGWGRFCWMTSHMGVRTRAVSHAFFVVFINGLSQRVCVCLCARSLVDWWVRRSPNESWLRDLGNTGGGLRSRSTVTYLRPFPISQPVVAQPIQNRCDIDWIHCRMAAATSYERGCTNVPIMWTKKNKRNNECELSWHNKIAKMTNWLHILEGVHNKQSHFDLNSSLRIPNEPGNLDWVHFTRW